MRNHVGLVDAAVSGAQSRIVESDWTLGSLPSGWTSSYPSIGGVPVYSGTGTYSADVTSAGGAYFQYNITTGGYTNATLAIAYDVTAWTTIDSALGVSGVPSSDVYMQYFPTASTSDNFGYDLGPQFDSIPTGTVTGRVVFAATMTSAGVWKLFRLNPGAPGTDTVQTITDVPPASSSVSFITAAITAYDFVNSVSGVSGDVKLAHTYFNLDAALNQASIEALATSWGWS